MTNVSIFTLYVLFNRFKTMCLLLQSIGDIIRVHCFDFDATTDFEEYLVPKTHSWLSPSSFLLEKPKVSFRVNQH